MVKSFCAIQEPDETQTGAFSHCESEPTHYQQLYWNLNENLTRQVTGSESQFAEIFLPTAVMLPTWEQA